MRWPSPHRGRAASRPAAPAVLRHRRTTAAVRVMNLRHRLEDRLQLLRQLAHLREAHRHRVELLQSVHLQRQPAFRRQALLGLAVPLDDDCRGVRQQVDDLEVAGWRCELVEMVDSERAENVSTGGHDRSGPAAGYFTSPTRSYGCASVISTRANAGSSFGSRSMPSLISSRPSISGAWPMMRPSSKCSVSSQTPVTIAS